MWATIVRRETHAGSLLRRRRPALRRHRLILGVVDLEHRVEGREVQELLDALRRVDEDQLSVLRRELAEVSDELTDAGRVDVVDLREVDDDVRALVLQHVLERRREKLRALAELDETFDVENREVVEMLLFDDHQVLPSVRKLPLR